MLLSDVLFAQAVESGIVTPFDSRKLYLSNSDIYLMKGPYLFLSVIPLTFSPLLCSVTERMSISGPIDEHFGLLVQDILTDSDQRTSRELLNTRRTFVTRFNHRSA